MRKHDQLKRNKDFSGLLDEKKFTENVKKLFSQKILLKSELAVICQGDEEKSQREE